jgi:2-methylcitrate dehydratase PrpD
MNPADPTDPVAQALAEFVHRLRIEEVPGDVSLRARHLMLDAVGCAMAARREPFAARFWSTARALSAGTTGNAGVIGHAERLPLRDATLLNGVLMHGLDYDDTHIAGVIHLTVSVLPALLSLASQRDLPGGDVLVAYIAGVEAGARLAMAVKGGFHRQGFHPTGVVGAFAAALAVGRLLNLDPRQLVQAQGAALSMAAGSLQFIEDGAWTKRLHAGWAAQVGITAAMLASEGVVAPVAPYTGRYGLFHSYLDESARGDVDLALATLQLGGAGVEPLWQLPQIAVKPFAMCHFVHAATDAAIELHRTGLDTAEIRDIEVLVPQASIQLVCEPADRKRRPQNDYDAKFSLPYAVASGLLRGKLGLKELEPTAFLSDEVQTLMDRVRYSVDSESTFPRHYSGEVRVTLADGSRTRHREAVNRGHPDRPLTNAEVREKFIDNATLHFVAPRARAIEAAVLELDGPNSTRRLEDVLAVDPD